MVYDFTRYDAMQVIKSRLKHAMEYSTDHQEFHTQRERPALPCPALTRVVSSGSIFVCPALAFVATGASFWKIHIDAREATVGASDDNCVVSWSCVRYHSKILAADTGGVAPQQRQQRRDYATGSQSPTRTHYR